MKKQFIIILTMGLLLVSTVSCKKNWLDEKPDKSLVVPATLTDFQAILDNSSVFNLSHPALSEMSTDDILLQATNWNNLLTATERNAYIWNEDIYNGGAGLDWNNSYKQVFTANTVLEGLEKITVSSAIQTTYNNIKGSALYYRANAFYNLSQLFCKPYNPASAVNDVGIPLKRTADINEPIVRASVEATYQQIIDDLNVAKTLLPLTTSFKTRPSKPAAFGLLARTYLAMEHYDKAEAAADSCLSYYNVLIDYNSLNTTANNPISRFNSEVLFQSTIGNNSIFLTSNLLVDTVLYSSYQLNDIRKQAFFRPSGSYYSFKGSYDGGNLFFNGIAVNEIYLIKAEAAIRQGKIALGMQQLNLLLQKRWKTGTYVPFTAATQNDALSIVLTERRKELLFRGLRWSDLRRYNQHPELAKTLIRKINTQVYTLQPNTNRYVLPIPDNEILISGIQQNERN